MSEYKIKVLPRSEIVLAEHVREMPQKNELCGAFWITLALRALGEIDIEQDHVGHAANSILSEVQTSESLPPGNLGRSDYILELPRIADSSITGTSPQGLMEATSLLAEGKLIAIPLTCTWTGELLERILDFLVEMDKPVLVIANSATRFLWGGEPGLVTTLSYLSGSEVSPPAPDWNVGHYIGIMGWVQGSKNKLAICADTYQSIGLQGMHLQPFDNIAASLRRDDSEFSGGMFIVINPEHKEEILEQLATLNISNKLWDNGTPYLNENTDHRFLNMNA